MHGFVHKTLLGGRPMANLRLTVISGDGDQNCAGKHCPTVYRSDDGRVFVQGWRVDPGTRKSVVRSGDEDLVEVPADLLKNLGL